MLQIKEKDIIQLCIKKLCDLYGTSIQLNGTKAVGGGCINNAVKIDCSAGEFFLKWNASAAGDLFLREAEGLDEMRLADNPYIVVPKVIWAKETDNFPGLILMEYLQPATKTSGFDEQLGRGIACLHRKTAAAFGFHHSNYCGTTLQNNTWTEIWPEFFAGRRIWNIVQQIKLARGMSVEELKIYEKLVEKMPGLLYHNTFPSLIHGDLWSGNYMFTFAGPALIDPASYYADREMELGMMQLFGGFSPEVWNAYQEEFPLEEGWQRRVQLYQLYHVLNHQLLFGGSYGWQAVEIARSFI
ncbi:MAG: fructosamine kinase family protein [Prolixibacteraceae bacterium]|jgi:fructosamine-3-kinase